MVGWLKQKCNDLLFKIFPILPSYIAAECYEEFDEKYEGLKMTKRFTTNNGVFYTDNETGWEFQSYGEVVELLNKLNDENKTFREALKELKEIGDYQVMRIRELDDENQKLEKENEQLKSENLKLFNALKSMCDVEICQVCKHNELLIFESMMYPTEYDTRCKKGFKDVDGKYYGIEVQECDCFEVCEEW